MPKLKICRKSSYDNGHNDFPMTTVMKFLSNFYILDKLYLYIMHTYLMVERLKIVKITVIYIYFFLIFIK